MVRCAAVKPLGSVRSRGSRSNFNLPVHKPSTALPQRMALRATSSEVNPRGKDEWSATAVGIPTGLIELAGLLLFQGFQNLSTHLVHHRQVLARIKFTLAPDAVTPRRQLDGAMLLVDNSCWRAENAKE